MEQLNGVLARLLAYDKNQMPRIESGTLTPPELIKDMSSDDYFADRTRMNSSAIKKILKSPRHFLADWKSEDEEDEADHFRIGRAAHLMLLEPDKFRQLHVVEPEFIGVTKDGKPTKNPNAIDVKNQREEWRSKQSPQALILTEEEVGNLVGMIESVLEHPIANSMLKKGVAESVIKWTDRDTGVMCKGKPDYLTFEDNKDFHLIDFKTSRNIQSGVFMRDIVNLQYHLSMAFYADGLLEVYGRLPSTLTIFPVEKTPPYEAAVFVLDDDWYDIGRRMYKDGLELYKKCIDSGKWPAFSSKAEAMSMPQWAQDYSAPEFKF